MFLFLIVLMTGDLFLRLSETDWTGIAAIGTFGAAFASFWILLQSKDQIKDAQKQFEIEKTFREKSLALLTQQNQQLQEQNQQLIKIYNQRQKERLWDESVFYSRVRVEYKEKSSIKGIIKVHKDKFGGPGRYRNLLQSDKKEDLALIPQECQNGNSDFKTKTSAIESIQGLYDIIDYDL